jgi:FecR protein
MRKHAWKFGAVLILALTFALAPQRAAADDDDPPSRVARLSHADGSVSFEPAGTEDWVTAVINRPVTTGDKLWADQNSRAELQLGSATIRVGATTGFSFLNLGDNTTQIQLTEGTIRISVRRLERDEIYEVDTPNLAFSLLRPGIYTINVNQGGDTTVVHVRSGEGEVTGGGESYTVHANESGTFSGTDQLTADVEGIGNPDDLETWSEERDARWEHAPSRRYVSEDAVGYEDLDEYGSWRDTPDYGTIWFPRAAEAGWAPYRYGHWAYIYPWGYTWVDDEPWGFAPFHYGRWVVVGGSWGWIPCRPAAVGVAYVRPVYAPALVAWVGGPNVAVGIAVGGGPAVGWFPLGPREVYVPSYRVSRTYVNQVNITNTTVNTTVVNNYYNNVVVNKNTTITNVKYVNQTVPGAVTATSQETLSTGRPVHSNIVRVNEQQIARAPIAAAGPAVAPQRQAFIGAGRPAAAKPPAPVVTRAVVAKTAPPPPPPRVDRQIAAVQQNGGRPIAISQARAIEKQEQPRAAVKIAPPAKPAQPQNVGRGGQPQNQNRPGQQPANVQPNAPANAPSNAQPTRPPNAQPNERPNERPNAQPNRPNEQPNRPPNAQPQPNERPNTPPNAQPNRPPANERPNNERNDRPPSAQPNRPPNAQPNAQPNRPSEPNRPPNAQPNERPNAQPNERPNARPPEERPNTPPPSAQPNRPPSNERPNNERNDRPPSTRPSTPPPSRPPEERPQAQPQPQPRQEERPQPAPRQEERPQPQPRPQERPQPQPRQEERPQPPPRQQERPQPQPRPQEKPQERPQSRPQQQEKPKQNEKPPKEKEKDKPPKK